jgi:hypothetical protein
VKASNDLVRDAAIREFYERKAARPTRVPIHRQRHLRGLADRSEMLSQLALVHAIVKIPNEQPHAHARSLLNLMR